MLMGLAFGHLNSCPSPTVCPSLVISPSCSCRLNYLLAGGLHPVGFHVLNIILHAVISALMIDVFAILIGGLAYDEKDRILNNAPKTSLLAALLFAAHPVHTESVSRLQNQVQQSLFFISDKYSRIVTCSNLMVTSNKSSSVTGCTALDLNAGLHSHYTSK